MVPSYIGPYKGSFPLIERPAKRFRQERMQSVYETMLRLAANRNSECYHIHTDGTVHIRSGAGHRAAFWQGYEMQRRGKIVRTANAIPGTLSWACLRAGIDFAKADAKANG